MPPVDVDSLVSVCGGGGTADNKIACETLAGVTAAAVPENPDLPPDSFWISKDAELDWFDRNAFFDRKDSTRGGGINSNSTNLNQPTASVSQRFSVNLTKSKTSIFGLPKPQKLQATQVCRRTCRPPNVRLFPKRTAPATAPAAVAEPSSPKVSCMGRVRSKRDRSRRSGRNRPPLALEALRQKEKTGQTRRRGLWTSLTSIFRSVSKTKPVQRDNSYLPAEEVAVVVAAHGSLPRERELPPRRSTASAMCDCSDSDRQAVGPPGLGGAMRFSSGRRSESWVVVDDADSSRVEEAGAASDRDPVWGRRGMGPLGLDEVQCRRQWESMGPSTV